VLAFLGSAFRVGGVQVGQPSAIRQNFNSFRFHMAGKRASTCVPRARTPLNMS